MAEFVSPAEDSQKKPTILYVGLEIFVIIPVLIVILVLNYFNIFALSRIYPDYFGFLPHQIDNKGQLSMQQNPEAVRTGSILKSYINEVMKPEYHPQGDIIASSKEIPELEIKEYSFSWLLDDRLYKVQLHEKMGNEAKLNENKLLDINLFVLLPGFTPEDVSENSALTALSSRFNIPNEAIGSAWIMQDNPSTAELRWNNGDGTKGSISVVPLNPDRPSEYYGLACKIFEDFKYYQIGSCISDE